METKDSEATPLATHSLFILYFELLSFAKITNVIVKLLRLFY